MLESLSFSLCNHFDFFSTTIIGQMIDKLSGKAWIHTACPQEKVNFRSSLWTSDGIMVNPLPKCDPQSRMKSRNLTVSIAVVPPWSYPSKDPGRKPVKGFAGIDVRIIEALSLKLGFDFTFKMEKNLGGYKGNGTWDGTTGSVRQCQPSAT